METEQTTNLTQTEISNIARMAFLRGKVEGTRGLIEYFETFRPKMIKKEELIASLEFVLGKFIEAL